MKKGKWIGAAAALVLAGSLTVSPAMAFFTANTEASGVRGIRFGVDTELEEEIESNTKLIRIKNTGESPCWVRARFFYGKSSEAGLSPTVTVTTGEGWKKGTGDDEWYYYTKVLEAPENEEDEKLTDVLKAAYEVPEKAPDYDIIVVYEYMPFMGEEGDDAYTKVDWKMKADPHRTGTGNVPVQGIGGAEPEGDAGRTGSDAVPEAE